MQDNKLITMNCPTKLFSGNNYSSESFYNKQPTGCDIQLAFGGISREGENIWGKCPEILYKITCSSYDL